MAEALHFVLDAAGLEVDRTTVGDAVHAAAADADPLAFSRFELEVHQAVDGALPAERRSQGGSLAFKRA